MDDPMDSGFGTQEGMGGSSAGGGGKSDEPKADSSDTFVDIMGISSEDGDDASNDFLGMTGGMSNEFGDIPIDEMGDIPFDEFYNIAENPELSQPSKTYEDSSTMAGQPNVEDVASGWPSRLTTGDLGTESAVMTPTPAVGSSPLVSVQSGGGNRTARESVSQGGGGHGRRGSRKDPEEQRLKNNESSRRSKKKQKEILAELNAQIKILEDENERLDDKNLQLRQEIRPLKKEYRRLHAENQHLLQQNQQLNWEIEEIQRENQQLQEQLQDAEWFGTATQAQLDNKSVVLQQLRTQKERLETLVADLQEDNRKNKARLVRLRKQQMEIISKLEASWEEEDEDEDEDEAEDEDA